LTCGSRPGREDVVAVEQVIADAPAISIDDAELDTAHPDEDGENSVHAAAFPEHASLIAESLEPVRR